MLLWQHSMPKEFQLDVLMGNPPFAGDIKESRIIECYDLAKKPNTEEAANEWIHYQLKLLGLELENAD